jgi:hypothetical protein
MSFEIFLKNELSKPVSEYYDPDGNSERAVVIRGLKGELLNQYKRYPKRMKNLMNEFDKLDTPIGWFVQVIFMSILSPILPVFAGFHWYNKSLKTYQDKYDKSQGINNARSI